MKIRLQNLRIYAFHGVHPVESKLGTWFRIDLQAELPEDILIDYVDIYALLQQNMQKQQLYLETVVRNLGQALLDKFPAFQSLSLIIRKEYPPLKGLEKGYFSVEFNFP